MAYRGDLGRNILELKSGVMPGEISLRMKGRQYSGVL